MRSAGMIQTIKRSYIVISVLLCAIGLWMAFMPDLPLAAISIIIGMVLGVTGVVKLIGYLSRDLYQLAFQFDLAFGILLMALSAAMFLHPEHVISSLCIILGITILTDGLLKIQTSIDARRFGLETWWLILLAAIPAGAAGPGTPVQRRNKADSGTVPHGTACMRD